MPSELLQLVTPASPLTPGHARAALPRHASAWPTPAPRRAVVRVAGRDRTTTLQARPRTVEAVAPVPVYHPAPAPEVPGVALAQPAIQPRAPESEVIDAVTPAVVGAPEPHPVTIAPAPPAAPIAEAAVAAPVTPPASPATQPAPAPVTTTPTAPVANRDEHEEREGD